jgi:23S rRNA pseudouridine1911/1915/1917 synthase
MKNDKGTIAAAISRDAVRRVRMTTRGRGGRDAVTHYVVQRHLESDYGKFTLLEVRIDTGRTHQIRVHLSSLGHPIVGDTLYGAPREIANKSGADLFLPRNFLHAAELQFTHPATGERLSFARPIPDQLGEFLRRLE